MGSRGFYREERPCVISVLARDSVIDQVTAIANFDTNPHQLHNTDAAYCCRRSSVICLYVQYACLSVGHNCEPCRNG